MRALGEQHVAMALAEREVCVAIDDAVGCKAFIAIGCLETAADDEARRKAVCGSRGAHLNAP